jgi:hypothetical protein
MLHADAGIEGLAQLVLKCTSSRRVTSPQFSLLLSQAALQEVGVALEGSTVRRLLSLSKPLWLRRARSCAVLETKRCLMSSVLAADELEFSIKLRIASVRGTEARTMSAAATAAGKAKVAHMKLPVASLTDVLAVKRQMLAAMVLLKRHLLTYSMSGGEDTEFLSQCIASMRAILAQLQAPTVCLPEALFLDYFSNAQDVLNTLNDEVRSTCYLAHSLAYVSTAADFSIMSNSLPECCIAMCSSTAGACRDTSGGEGPCAGAAELASTSAANAQAQHLGDLP